MKENFKPNRDLDLMPRAHFDAISAQLSDACIKTELRESLRHPKSLSLPKVIEQEEHDYADYQRSGEIAKEHNGNRIRLERLPELLNDPDFIKSIEDTESYKRYGHAWFWTDTVGTYLDGHYRINPKAKTLDEMFQFISKEFDSKVEAVPFNKRAYFSKGNQPLSVEVRRSDVYWRLGVVGYYWLGIVAPLAVVAGEDAV